MANLTYPGVYVDELSSGVHAITGVSTSITAFVGRALRGPVDEPVTITSYLDFERVFGGLWSDSRLGYAVRDFYEQGGSTAIIVRVFKGAAADTAKIDMGADLKLEARAPGAWGSGLTAAIDQNVAPGDNTLYNLTVVDTGAKVTEVFRNVSNKLDHPRKVDHVVATQSRLIKVSSSTANRPAVQAATAAGTATDGSVIDDAAVLGTLSTKTGLYALEDADLVNLIVVPPYKGSDIDQIGNVSAIVSYAHARRAMVILDPETSWTVANAAANAQTQSTDKDAAVFFPWIRKADPLRDSQILPFPPSGAIAGVLARTDATRGVWKAPAGLEAKVGGVVELDVRLSDNEIGLLNPHGVNCLRAAPGAGHVVWGSRTRNGDDRIASEWKYLPVRRTALFLEESLYRGLQWVVFEPNDEPLWAQIRLNAGAFMNNLFRQGAFQGTTPKDAYFVKCDSQTTTQDDINLGIVNIIVGFAPLKPAEFVVVKLQQMAGQAGGA
jgi:phage tail sheath protein FI